VLVPSLVHAAEPLVITNAEVANITNIDAVVSWQTNRESTSVVTYSQTPCPCGQGISDSPDRRLLAHEMTVTGLTANRTYYVQPISIDADGVRVEGPILSFTTLRDASSLPIPEFSDVRIEQTGPNVVVIRWKTQVALRGSSGVEYGTSPCPCNQNSQTDLGTGTDHRVEVAPLEPLTTYFFRPFSYHPKDTGTLRYGTTLTATTFAGKTPTSSSSNLTLQYPNGGERWKQGEQHLVAWKIIPGFVQSLRISLVNDGSSERTILLSSLPAEQRSNGSTALTIPGGLASGSYHMELANALNLSDQDTSDASITIGDQPTPPPAQAATETKPASTTPPTFLPGQTQAAPTPAATNPPAAETTKTGPTTEEIISSERALLSTINAKLSHRLRGRILLQIQGKGEAWYVNPSNEKRSYLGRPADAFNVMRKLGLGVKHDVVANLDGPFSARLTGKILIDVDDHGAAYYISPTNQKAYSLGRPTDAFNIMRKLGLGIDNANLHSIDIE